MNIKRIFYFCIGLYFLFILSVLFFPANEIFAQTKKSPDAIAIRVIPNPKHLSALNWYKAQDFKGSPQSIQVDGYRAIRDGRTVYVNASNIDAGTLYTNIYILSYTQEAEAGTVDIFSRIISNWKFNKNLNSLNGHCRKSPDISCLGDAECPINDFCDSRKARVVRDTRRLEDMAVIQNTMNSYKKKNGYYPKLKGGSYLLGKTISVWPSWQEAFSAELGIKAPADPINELGPCSADRFNKETCWDEEAKQFDDSDPSDPLLNIPNNSLVYTYNGKEDGSSYNLCGVMESGYNLSLNSCVGAGVCLVGSGQVNVETSMENHAPEFLGFNFPLTYAFEEYSGYLQAIDPDGDPLTWSIAGVWTSWINPPILQDIGVRGQRKIYSPKAGTAGRYDFTVTINDGRGEANSQVTKNYYIIISHPKPKITLPLSCASAVRKGANYPPCTIVATHPYSAIVSFEYSGLPVGMVGNAGTGIISGIPTNDGSYSISIVAVDSTGTRSFPQSYTLQVRTYCGDAVYQASNMEGVIEHCDGVSNVAATTVESKASRQYSCNASCGYTGGYCGDSTIFGQPLEDCDDGKNGSNSDQCHDNCKFTTCGDGVIQTPNGLGKNEECDGSKLNGATCLSEGFSGGVAVFCDPNCDYNISACCNVTNGGWTDWSSWTCSAASGSGTETRTRTCTNPSPSCGGADCVGSNIETRGCCIPPTCATLGCGVHANPCGGTLDCGACCVPNCSIDNNNYCTGTNYIGNCGQTCTGVKNCLACVPNCSIDNNNFCTGTNYIGNCGQSCAGLKTCPVVGAPCSMYLTAQSSVFGDCIYHAPLPGNVDCTPGFEGHCCGITQFYVIGSAHCAWENGVYYKFVTCGGNPGTIRNDGQCCGSFGAYGTLCDGGVIFPWVSL